MLAVCAAVNTVSPIDNSYRADKSDRQKMLKEAILRQDMDYIIDEAMEQVESGAEILDVNVGVPGIDEKQMMEKVVKAIQSMVDAPLQIDSSDPAVIEAGLRAFHGKAIVNSVNGDRESLDRILPLVKKYGAAVIGLTLDERGIPKNAEQRFEIAGRILERALWYGIPRENVFIDCLTLTASAEQDAVAETLKALRMCKEKLGLKTVLGVSNVSFGLPCRQLINQTFLTLALAHGLDLPIVNPNDQHITDALRAFRLLYNYDKGGFEFIKAVEEKEKQDNGFSAQAANNGSAGGELGRAVENGLKAEAARLPKICLERLTRWILSSFSLSPRWTEREPRLKRAEFSCRS